MWPFRKTPTEAQPRVQRDNRWPGGDVNLVFPPLSEKDIGASGASFREIAFRPEIGPEMFLHILEVGQWAQRYGMERLLTLVASTLAVATEEGPVAIVIWRFSRGEEALIHYEHYLDPLHAPTRDLLKRIEQQTRLKVVMRDNRSGETAGFWEFDNTFRMGDFADGLARTASGRAGPLDRRIALLQKTYRLEDLIAAVEGR